MVPGGRFCLYRNPSGSGSGAPATDPTSRRCERAQWPAWAHHWDWCQNPALQAATDLSSCGR